MSRSAPFDVVPTDFDPDTSIGYLSKRIHQASLGELERLFDGEPVNYLQWTALISVLHGRAANCRELARDLAYDSGATTRLLDALEQKGLIERHRSAQDRRVINLALTQIGSALAERCLAHVLGMWRGWLADWEQADIVQLIAYLRRLRATIEGAAVRT